MDILKTTISLAVILALTACNGKGDSSRNALQPVKTCRPTMTGDAGCLQFPGKVISDDKAYTAFKVGGRIASLNVKEGDRVKAGQIIGSLDRTDYQVALDAVEAEYNSVSSEAQRIIALYEENATTKVAYDKAVYGLQQISAKLSNARNRLNDTMLSAPTDGVVKTVLRHAGEVVGAGMPVLEIVDNDAPLVEIKIPASAFAGLNKYSAYSCRFDAYPDSIFPLKLYAAQSIANANQLYTVKFAFAMTDTRLPAVGMSTTVMLCDGDNAGGDNADTRHWIVPATAIAGEGDSSYIFTVTPDSILTLTPVTVVRLTRDGEAEIKSAADLAEAVIVAAGAGKLSPDAKVKPLAPSSPTNIGNQL